MISQSMMPFSGVVLIRRSATSGKPGMFEVILRTLETSTVWFQDSMPLPSLYGILLVLVQSIGKFIGCIPCESSTST